MNIKALTTMVQLEEFLAGAQPIAFTVLSTKDECYHWIQGILVKFEYLTRSKSHKGLILRYLQKMSGYSRQQLTRLIQQYRQAGRITRRQRTVKGFVRRYTTEDIRLLAAMDERHGTPSGPAIKKLCERACQLFGQTVYTRLAGISIGHLYNLRKSTEYRRQRHAVEKTRPTRSRIGERRKPQPAGQPGFLRIDTVHQGDLDKQKGVYHINAVDEVTQFQVVCPVEKISEASLLPALTLLLAAFPFRIRGFHSDNGSEYINGRVARAARQTLDRIHQIPGIGRRMTTPSWKVRMGPWCANSLVMPTFPNVGPRSSIRSIRSTSILMSTFIGPTSFRRPGQIRRARNASSTVMPP